MTTACSQDLTAAAEELAAAAELAGKSLDGLLDRVVELTVRTVGGATEASITWIDGERSHTAAWTGQLAAELDEWQYRHGHGPCLEAAGERTTVVATDLTTDIRWYSWTAHAVAAGARGAMSIGLAAGERAIGALNIYARTTGALDGEVARVFAANVAAALGTALRYG
jgi:hypothetical protein